ncbi:MAG: transporter substrate-binding domain-containing protein [Desulfohalobium sp.]
MNNKQTCGYMRAFSGVIFWWCGVIVLLASVLGSGALAMAAPEAGRTPDGPDRDAGQSSIHVAPDPHWPPIEFLDDHNRYQGLAADYLRELTEDMGVSLRVRRVPDWQAAVQAVRSGEADILGAARKTSSREEFARFTEPYFEVENVLVARKSEQDIAALSDLSEVGVVQGYAVVEHLRRAYPELELKLVDTTATGLRRLARGELRALVTELPALSYHQTRLGLANLRIVHALDYSYPLRFAVRRDAPELHARLNEALSRLSPEKRRELNEQWIGLDHSALLRDSQFWRRVLGLALLAVLAVFVPLYRMQRQKIRRRTRELQTSEDKFRSVFEQSQQMMALLTVEGMVVDANDRALEFVGAERAILRGEPLTTLPWWSGSDKEKAEMDAAIRVAASGDVVYGRSCHDSPAGRSIWVEYSVKPVWGDGETPQYLIVEGRDVTAYVQAKQALEKNERMLSTLLANLPGMVYRCSNDPRWKMEYVSHGCLELTGYTPETMTKRIDPEYGDLIVQEDREQVMQAVESALTAREPFQVTYRICDAHGEVKWVREQGRGVWSEAQNLESVEGFVTDITAQRQLEEQLRRSQRLESVGRLAGWAAHDFNNMLTPILGYAEILLSNVPQDSSSAAQLEHIRAAAERARQLARQLLAFSRNQVMSKQRLDVRDMVEGFRDILRQGVREDIALEVRPSEAPCQIIGDAHQLEQVVMNLVLNAQDAMLEGGYIWIDVSPMDLDASYHRQHPDIDPGAYVQLSVSDNGVGMDAATLRQAFDPFFTTKGEEGTGLGLSSVHGIMKQHGGHAEIYSEPGNGTVIKLFLPRVQHEADSAAQTEELQEPVEAVGHETVLVVEDNEMVRELTCEVLQSFGYDVLSAADPREGIRLAQDTDTALALLVTDVVMPYMDGRELYQQLRAERQDLRALFISGYTDNHIASTGGMEPGTGFLQKPFTSQELGRQVRRLLDR